jgi:hypothetical protein
MPLETIGSYAVAGSTGAIARGARQNASLYDVANNNGFAASSARGGASGGQEIRLPTSSTSPNVAVYLSPFIRLDLETRLAIVEFRDSKTGTVKQQYPSPRVVEEYRQNLPESSDLLQPPQAQVATTQNLQPRVIGSDQDKSSSKSSKTDSGSDATTAGTDQTATAAAASQNAPAPQATTPAPAAQAAAAAFSAAQSSPASSRELAVA